jgi:hypothetical protein
MKALRALDTYWRMPQPAERLAALRLVIGLFALIYVVARAPHLASYAHFPLEQFRPVGVVALLQVPPPPFVTYAILALCVLSGLAFVAGGRYRLSGPVFALTFLWVTTYRCSWGMIFHQDNLVAVHLLILAVVPAADAWSWDARDRKLPEANGRYGWPVRSLTWVTITTYVLAGVAKLQNDGLDWGETLRSHVAYDALRKLELGSTHAAIGAWMVQFSATFWVLLGAMTLVLELGAPLAALGGRVRTAWVLGMWGFHVGVLALMAIAFVYPLTGCAFASFFAVERPVGWCLRWARQRLKPAG